MTKNEVISQIKNDINVYFNDMNHIEYSELCHGTGTLSVLDEILNNLPKQFRFLDPTVETVIQSLDEYDIAELTDYCNEISDKRGKQLNEAQYKAYAEIICEHNYEGNPRRYYNETINSAKSKYCEETGYDVDDVICLTKD